MNGKFEQSDGQRIESIAYKPVTDKVTGILELGGRDIPGIKRTVEKALQDMSVPFTHVDIEEDKNREDNQQLCIARVYVPNSWPTDIGYEGEYCIFCWVDERVIEPEEHN